MGRPGPVPPAAMLLWAGALLCWVWLWRGARSRARLLEALGTKHGGFVRTQFSWLTMTREARELSFVRMVGNAPCRFRIRFSLPAPGAGRPATVIEFDAPEAVFGVEPCDYSVADAAGGRGLFLGGANLTEAYLEMLGEVPPVLRPAVAWQGPTARLVVPALLGMSEEPWCARCLTFMELVADRTCPEARNA